MKILRKSGVENRDFVYVLKNYVNGDYMRQFRIISNYENEFRVNGFIPDRKRYAYHLWQGSFNSMYDAGEFCNQLNHLLFGGLIFERRVLTEKVLPYDIENNFQTIRE